MQSSEGEAAVDLEAKAQPAQKRSRETYIRILTVTGELLEEVGMERISTNMVAKRAGISPPALYRYFPNKYALIVALAELIYAQFYEALAEWVDAGGLDTHSVEEATESNFVIQQRVTALVREFPGGIWILRSIHALPALREVANRFRTEVVERLLVFQKRRYGHIPEAELRTAVRLTTEMFLATIAMLLEDPELDEDKINYEICKIVATYYGKF